MVIKMKGRLKFQPENKTKKHEVQDWKKVAMITLKCDLDEYYAWFLTNRFGLNFVKNVLRGAHITIISDRVNTEMFEEASKLFENKEIIFYYELEPRTNTKHWWLRVHCPEAELIRQSLGLTKEPYFGFHMTIGYVNELNLGHSEYVYGLIKKHKILSSEPRKDLSKHSVVDFSKAVPIKTDLTQDNFVYNKKEVFYRNGSYTSIKNQVIK